VKLKRNSILQSDFRAVLALLPDESIDLIICDGPYGLNKGDWDNVSSIQEFNLKLIKMFSKKLKRGGSLYLFGKPDCLDFVDYRPYLNLKSKIVWYQPSRLAQGRVNYTNNYDVIYYFSKGQKAQFHLDDIRVPQLVELEHRRRCENVPSVKKGRFGKTAFNVAGKNPGDVWGDIKQLTYKSKELISREMLNTIQKPERLIERLVKASSSPGDLVFDPFSGSGTTASVCKKLGRDFICAEINKAYFELSIKRLKTSAKFSEKEGRPIGRPQIKEG